MGRWNGGGAYAALAVVCAVAASGSPRAEERAIPDATEVEEALPEGGRLTGRELYERFLANRFKQSSQDLRIISRDPGGSEQQSIFSILLRDFRDEDDNAVGGVLAKSLIEVTDPFDMRHTTYLLIAKDPGPDDQFIYQPSQRQVRRVDLKSTSLLGTDYTFNDIAFQNIEDAEYVRLPDESIDGATVYVVEARLKPSVDTEYHRTITYMDQEHYVPLRQRYWDDYDVEIKEMRAPPSTMRDFDGVWVATESTMRDLRQQTSSTLFVEAIDTEPDLGDRHFSLRRLSRRH